MPVTSELVRAQIRELRYMDGWTCERVAGVTGIHPRTVGKIAPGRPGKVSNDRVRAMFERSRLSAHAVAQAMGWEKAAGDGRASADGRRVLRALGLLPEVSRGYESFRSMIDAETAMLLAEAMGHAGWEALPDDE